MARTGVVEQYCLDETYTWNMQMGLRCHTGGINMPAPIAFMHHVLSINTVYLQMYYNEMAC